MKKLLIITASVCVIGILFVGCRNNGRNNKTNQTESAQAEMTVEEEALAEAPQASGLFMEMVVDADGNVVGHYVCTNDDGTYTFEVQDTGDVPIEGYQVVVFTPENGQGVVYSIKEGNVNVRQQPSTDASIIGKICTEEGFIPDTYPCLGKEGEWFKILFEGQEGYVREDLVNWDGMDTF